MHMEIISIRRQFRMPMWQLVKVTEVFVFVSPFNSLIVHGSGVFTLDSCHLSLISSQCLHFLTLFTESLSLQSLDIHHPCKLRSRSRTLASHWSVAPNTGPSLAGGGLCPADRRGSHDAQSSVWKSGLFIAARTQLAALCTPVTCHTRVHFHSRDEM